LGVSVTLVRDNVAELDALLALAHEAGATYAELRALVPFGEGTATLALDDGVLSTALRTVLDAWHERMELTVHDLPHCALSAEYERFMMGRSSMPRVTVTRRGVDWGAYTASQRAWRAVCEGCPARLECDGFYELTHPTQPAWRM
jgi:MoaA/NifB/PqqE/SkfB family radical SAM enzyme